MVAYNFGFVAKLNKYLVSILNLKYLNRNALSVGKFILFYPFPFVGSIFTMTETFNILFQEKLWLSHNTFIDLTVILLNFIIRSLIQAFKRSIHLDTRTV